MSVGARRILVEQPARHDEVTRDRVREILGQASQLATSLRIKVTTRHILGQRWGVPRAGACVGPAATCPLWRTGAIGSGIALRVRASGLTAASLLTAASGAGPASPSTGPGIPLAATPRRRPAAFGVGTARAPAASARLVMTSPPIGGGPGPSLPGRWRLTGLGLL